MPSSDSYPPHSGNMRNYWAHKHNPDLSLKEGSIVIYGHYHIFDITNINEVTYINVGSTSIPKDNISQYAILDDKEIKIYEAIIGDDIYKEKSNGEIVKLYKDGIGVKVSDGEIILKAIKPSGSKKMNVKDYLNGFKEKNNLMGKVLGWFMSRLYIIAYYFLGSYGKLTWHYAWWNILWM